jgi:hypothetical protein
MSRTRYSPRTHFNVRSVQSQVYTDAAGNDLTADFNELNALDGATATATEINTLAGVTAGTAAASKATVLDANKQISGVRQTINLAAATQPLTAAMSGQRFVGAVDAVFTLPAAAAATKGVWYEFECGAVSAGTGLSVSPAATDHIRGNGLTAVDDKDLINTGATDRLGDSVRLYCDGVDGWVIAAVIGTWAKEA